MIWLHRYAKLVVAAAVVLISAGGLVTSTGSGLAVPDWPTTYGYFMFSFPLSKMVGGIIYEHGHRMIASIVGLLTIGLAGLLWWWERRTWVRRLGWIALVAVVLQGILGGITVLYFLPAPISIGHAGLAQVFLCLVVSVALFTSPGWQRGGLPARLRARDVTLERLGLGLPVLIYVQILVGAIVRHTGAGLAIPDFPLVFGGLVPPDWSPAVVVHFAHRVGALLAALLVGALAGHIWARYPGRPDLRRPAALLVALVAVQIALGGWTVLSQKAVAVNTAHVATGSLVLVTVLVLALRIHRHRFPDAVAPGAERMPALQGAGDRRAAWSAVK